MDEYDRRCAEYSLHRRVQEWLRRLLRSGINQRQNYPRALSSSGASRPTRRNPSRHFQTTEARAGKPTGPKNIRVSRRSSPHKSTRRRTGVCLEDLSPYFLPGYFRTRRGVGLLASSWAFTFSKPEVSDLICFSCAASLDSKSFFSCSTLRCSLRNSLSNMAFTAS